MIIPALCLLVIIPLLYLVFAGYSIEIRLKSNRKELEENHD
jgi:hypothetical protein